MRAPVPRLRITVVAGARPNLMKVGPVIAALQNRFVVRFVHTGQHYDYNLSEGIIRELGLPLPDINLNVGSATHTAQTAAIMQAFADDLLLNRPAAVVVPGDVNSTLACALTAAQMQIPVAHVEAGLRSHDWAMPEELNRVLTDRLSRWLFTTSHDAGKNLVLEGIDEHRIHFVGNTMVDSLFAQLPDARKKARPLLERLNLGSQFGLVTLHRGSNVDDSVRLSKLIDALGALAAYIPLVMPLHPRTRSALADFGLSVPANIRALEALTYHEFIGLQEKAALVLTDSGGVQEESSALGVPCLTLRSTTERPVTCQLGTNELLGLDVERILPAAVQALQRQRTAPDIPLWDGKSGSRIAGVLERDLLEA